MSVLTAILGLILILVVLGDAFETIVFPRRVTRRIRLARLFYRYTWRLWSACVYSMSPGRRQETYLSFYGPLSLLVLLALWATGLIVGFALVLWPSGTITKAGHSDIWQTSAWGRVSSFRKVDRTGPSAEKHF